MEGPHSRQGAFSGHGAYFFFEKQPNAENENLIRYFLKNNCNGNKYTVHVQLTFEGIMH